MSCSSVAVCPACRVTEQGEEWQARLGLRRAGSKMTADDSKVTEQGEEWQARLRLRRAGSRSS